MNKSDHKLKTINTQQSKKYNPHPQIIQKNYTKPKKQSTRKISLKQSVLKQNKDLYVPQLIPKAKRSHQIVIDNDHRYKIVRQIQGFSRSDEQKKRGNKYSNKNNNKSLIFSQHKLTNPLHSSTLKASKIFPSSDNKSSSNNNVVRQKQVVWGYSNKKNSNKGSTTKKHSKSVYNYTQFDQYPIVNNNKKHHTKQSQGYNNVSRQYHNRSSLTQQPHQVSTSSITKRVVSSNKPKQILNKILNNVDIKKKASNFKVLSNCLRQYVRQQQQLRNRVDIQQIIRLVKAFNRVQISKMSRPLQQLICQMIQLIQQTVHKDKLIQIKQYEQYKEQLNKNKNINYHNNNKSQLSHKLSNINKPTNKNKQSLINKQQIISNSSLISNNNNKYQTPQRLNSKSLISNNNILQSSKNKLKSFLLQSNQSQSHQKVLNPNDISKTKKFYPSHYDQHDTITQQQEIINNNHQNNRQQNYHSSLSKDLNQMQQGLQQLRSQSKQLKSFLQLSSNKKSIHQSHQKQYNQSHQKPYYNDQSNKKSYNHNDQLHKKSYNNNQSKHDQQQQEQQSEQKRLQINKLKQILQKQKLILSKINNYQHQYQPSNSQSSDQSSLKCYTQQQDQ